MCGLELGGALRVSISFEVELSVSMSKEVTGQEKKIMRLKKAKIYWQAKGHYSTEQIREWGFLQVAPAGVQGLTCYTDEFIQIITEHTFHFPHTQTVVQILSKFQTKDQLFGDDKSHVFM